jgi:methylmalonyl-CoA mutase N-terminal domain/subunit
VPHPYDPERRDNAERIQVERLKEIKKTRDNQKVAASLRELKTSAAKEDANLFPYLIECAKAYASIQEICDTLREVFGEYKPATL